MMRLPPVNGLINNMFTGIITDTTAILAHHKTTDGLSLTFQKPVGWADLEIGESVSTNGVCLTVVKIAKDRYSCHLMSETLAKTVFGITIPERVNLERALRVSDRFGGHFVQGHVDEVGKIIQVDGGDDRQLYIEFTPKNKGLVVNKGSITVDGVALTVSRVNNDIARTSLIPHTLQHTTLGTLKVGDKVNLEFDIIGKYILNITESRVS